MYYSTNCPKHGRNVATRIFFTLFIFIFYHSLLIAQTIPPPPLPACDDPSFMDSTCCEYVTNGNFDQLLSTNIDDYGGIVASNWWNAELNTSGFNDIWECLIPNYPSSKLPDLFSNSTSDQDFSVPYNIYSQGASINDPSLDGNYTAINLYEDQYGGTELTYLEQELSDYLYPDFTYQLSYYSRFAPVSSHRSDIGIYFTEDVLNWYDFSQGDPAGAFVHHSTPSTNGAWNLTQNMFSISPSSTPLKHITIGKLAGSLATQVNTNQFNGYHYGLFYIDSVHVRLIDAPDFTSSDTLCGNQALFTIEALKPHHCGQWSLVSGAGIVENNDFESTDVTLLGLGDFSIQYSFTCDTVVYTETYNYTLIEEYELSEESIVVCETEVNLSDFTDGVDGDWVVNTGQGNFYTIGNDTYFTGYGAGTTTLIFTPVSGSIPCMQTSYLLSIIYEPFPKTTDNTIDEDVWNDVAVDSEGNVYVVGTYVNSTEIEGNLISNDNDPSVLKPQFMLAKYDSCGTLLWWAWGKSACPSVNIGWSTANSIALDKTEGYNRVYITGECHQLRMENSLGDVDNVFVTGACTDDSVRWLYVLEINSETGEYEDFLHHIGNIEIINSIAVAQDGPNNHYVYLGGGAHAQNSWRGGVVKIQTVPNYASQSNLIQLSYDLFASSSYRNIINDIYYKNQSLYTVGTTFGPLTFGSSAITFDPNNQLSTAWVAKIFDGNTFSVQSITHGGEGGQIPVREMTGDQIYVDDHNNVIVSGLFSNLLYNPFYPSTIIHPSPSLNIFPTVTDAYIVRLDAQSLKYNGGFEVIQTNESQNEIKKIAMTGFKDNIYVSATYTGNSIGFLSLETSANSSIDFSGVPTPISSEKILVAHYETYPALVKSWHNTTLTYQTGDEHFVKANAAMNNKVYTVGNYRNYMDFTFDNNGVVDDILSYNFRLSAFIFRNDHFQSGMFKLYEVGNETDIESEFKAFPNPNSGSFYLSGIEEEEIFITDILGRNLSFTVELNQDKSYIQIENFKGIAIIKNGAMSIRIIVE